MSQRDMMESFGGWDAYGLWCERSDFDQEPSEPDPEAVIHSALDALDVEIDANDF